MVRPDGSGVRLFFAQEQPGVGRVTLLIGIEGQFNQLLGGEHAANVTVIDTPGGRFFSTQGARQCWVQVQSVTPSRPWGSPPGHRIQGDLYCLSALPALRDRSSLTLGELHFGGRVTSDVH